MIQILPMAQEHISTLAELERQCFADPWSEQALAEELSNPNAVFRVALIDGEVAGYVGMLHVLDEGDICNVAVFDRFRRKGVATALIDHLLNYGRENALAFITLEGENPTAVPVLFTGPWALKTSASAKISTITQENTLF